MSKAAAKFQKRTGWVGNAAGGASPKRQPYHADRRDVGAGTLRAANGGHGATAGPSHGVSQAEGQTAPCPYCPNAIPRENLERHIQKKHMRRPPRPRSNRPVVFLTGPLTRECPYCHHPMPFESLAKHQRKKHPDRPSTT